MWSAASCCLQGSRFPWLQKFTRIFIRAGFQHFLTFDAKPRQYEDAIARSVLHFTS